MRSVTHQILRSVTRQTMRSVTHKSCVQSRTKTCVQSRTKTCHQSHAPNLALSHTTNLALSHTTNHALSHAPNHSYNIEVLPRIYAVLALISGSCSSRISPRACLLLVYSCSASPLFAYPASAQLFSLLYHSDTHTHTHAHTRTHTHTHQPLQTISFILIIQHTSYERIS